MATNPPHYNYQLILDCDGVLTSTKKTYTQGLFGKLRKVKSFCDKDLWALKELQSILGQYYVTVLSQDKEINKKWCEKHNINFIYADKYISEDKRFFIRNKSKNYIYVGDSMSDLGCLLESAHAYVPKDASIILQNELKNLKKEFTILNTNGGDGVIEILYYDLRNKNFYKS